MLAAVEERSIPTASMYREAHPVALEDDRLTVEFPGEAEFHRKLAEDPKNAAILRDALYDVTGRKLAVTFTLGEKTGPAEPTRSRSTRTNSSRCSRRRSTRKRWTNRMGAWT